jgi:hypothetical protein
MFLLIGGCQSGRDSALTDADLERIALVQRIELVEAAGGLVLTVGGETVTSNEVIESPVTLGRAFVSPIDHFRPIAQEGNLQQFKERVRGLLTNILMEKISNILLYQHARRQAGEGICERVEGLADDELRKFVLDYGGNQAKADEALKEKRMDRKSFRERQKRLLLIQWYMSSKLPNNRPVTYRELMDCYNEIKDKEFARTATITLRLIDIQPAKLELADPNEDPRRLAEELADKLYARIEAGENFGELAKQYSHGPWREFGGLLKPVQPLSLAVPYDRLAAEAEKIEPGQTAKLAVTKENTLDRIFIMKLEDKQSAGYEPFDDVEVQRKVRNIVILDRRNDALNKLYAGFMRQAKLGRTDRFVDFCLEEIYRISRQQQ